MPSRSTPRLCAQCGHQLAAGEERVTLEDARTGEQMLLHRACFEQQFERARRDDGADPSI